MNIQDIKMTFKYIGYNTDKNMPDLNAYKVTLSYNNNKMTIDYHMGTALKQTDLTIESVINSLLLDYISDNTTFTDFCDEYGYDGDSIKDSKIYKACQKNTEKMNKLFQSDEIEALRKQLQDY